MKRHYLLIAGCLLGAVSVGLNIYLYQKRHNPPPKETSQQLPKQMVLTGSGDGFVIVDPNQPLVSPEKPGGLKPRTLPDMPKVKFDFSDTAFADDSWKLTDPPSSVSLDKPFDWEDVNPAKSKADPDNLFGVGDPPKKPPVIKESYAGSPAKVDGATVKPAPPSPSK
jgi:hypothetical protein